jgi:hypothetical protein
LNGADEIFFDGTFQITNHFKQKFPQLIVIAERVHSTSHRSQSIASPILLAYVPGKSSSVYETLFKIIDILIGKTFLPSILHTDMESGFIHFLDKHRKSININYCSVHVIRAWRSNSTGLLSEFDNYESVLGQFWSTLKGLPFLPVGKKVVHEILSDYLVSFKNNNVRGIPPACVDQLKIFCNYLWKNYFRTGAHFCPENWADINHNALLNRRLESTNNLVESLNNLLRNHIPTGHVSFHTSLETIHSMKNVCIENKIAIVKFGIIPRRTRRIILVRKTLMIKLATQFNAIPCPDVNSTPGHKFSFTNDVLGYARLMSGSYREANTICHDNISFENWHADFSRQLPELIDICWSPRYSRYDLGGEDDLGNVAEDDRHNLSFNELHISPVITDHSDSPKDSPQRSILPSSSREISEDTPVRPAVFPRGPHARKAITWFRPDNTPTSSRSLNQKPTFRKVNDDSSDEDS